MTKRLTEKEKEVMVNSFKDGTTIEYLSNKFKCTDSTIIRNLKKNLGEKKYKLFAKKNKESIQNNINEDKKINLEYKESDENNKLDKRDKVSNPSAFTDFVEIAPLDFEIENTPRKELSSVPISEIEFPKVVYLLVNKNIELEIKLLRDFPDWEFLPDQDLKRKTIEVFWDLKKAKRVCGKEQKVIKVPNTDVFRIVSPILISRGISRIVSSEKLIAL